MLRFAKQLKDHTNNVVLFFSGGKDAICSLDVLCEVGINVTPVFMYLAPDLRHNEEVLKWYENRYNLDIIRVPHFDLDDWNNWFYKVNSKRVRCFRN
mgnify:CR=1 FL=1